MKWKNRIIHAGILIVMFVIAVAGFSYFTNQGNDSMTADMGSASFPQVAFSYDGYTINTLSGYSKEMNIPYMRDTITPVNQGTLGMEILDYNNQITSVKWQVYTLDGETVLQEGQEKEPAGSISMQIDMEALNDREGVLAVVLTTDEDREIYYYTRITDADQKNILENLDYIQAFHENALGKVENAGVGTAIEPSEEGDNTTFQHVTIHSDYDHVTWGNLEPEVEQGERWSIKESNGVSTSVELQYLVRCKGEENETDLYRVTEYFRVRHVSTSGKTYLLDYDRTMEQIFDPTRTVLSEKGVLLGIADTDTPYLVNGDGTVVAFVTANELWNYSKDSDETSLIFSFMDVENTDERNLVSQHEIELLNMDEEGNLVFAVYGYMNRGEHEGEVGAAIYYYNISANSVDEKVFISSDKSYGYAILELGEYLYYSIDRNVLYLMLDGTVYEYDVEEDQKKSVVEGLEEGQYAVSENGRRICYLADNEEASVLKVLNLESGKEQEITCGEDECIRPLGFMKNDVVYGVARTADIGKTIAGESIVPMYKVEIQNSKGEIKKTYQADNTYVMGAEFENNMITLTRVTKEGDVYNNISPDYITNNEEKEESNIYLSTYTTELKETQVRLTYEDGITDKNPKILKPKQVLFESSKEVSFETSDETEQYYAYGYGKLRGCYDKAGEAIQKADQYNGVVVSSEQQYIWERGNRDLNYRISDKDEEIQKIQDLFAEGKSPVEIMKEINGGTYMDLTGCTAEELLYIINQDHLVIGMINTSKAIILMGYNEKNVIYIDMADGEQHSISYEEMDEMTEQSGNTYIS